MNYLDSLNESQRAAVTYCDGPQLVIAGAGSGKTRVLTMKVAYLLEHGYRPDQIMALTFTKKAATEMQQRIGQLVGPALARRLWMGTFHSIFARILRREAQRIGFRSDFTIYDQADSRSLVKNICKEMGLDDKKYKPASVQAQISNAKNNLVTPGMYRANREIMEYDLRSGRGRIAEVYERYWQRCRQAGAMDFDDLLLYTNILLRDNADVLEFYQTWFQYILVDEYQDTNRAQHLIVEQLVRAHRHLCVVGDDAQSIYSFRGANIRNILEMQRTVEGTRLFKLEQNYRSTQNIVNAANSLIAKNRDQIPKTIFSQKERGSLLYVTGTYSDLEEAQVVKERIVRLHDGDGYAYADIAILYRTNAQSRTLEEALRKAGIDYRIYGGLSFYQRKEIKDILAYMRLAVNPADEEAFRRVVNYPARGIGDTTVGRVAEAVGQTGLSFVDVCRDPVAHGVQVNRGAAAKLVAFTTLIDHFGELARTLNAYETTSRIIAESGIRADLQSDTSIEGQSRRENVEELLSAIQTFLLTGAMAAYDGEADDTTHSEEAESLDSATDTVRGTSLLDFLADVSLSGDVEPNEKDDDERDCVTMMTIHSAKGLEFPNVFIVGVEDGLLPNDMAFNEPGGVEEERRLLYVAITRAEQNCYLSYAMSRFRNGRSELSRPSRFLKDIDRTFLSKHGAGDAPSLDFSSSHGYTSAASPSFPSTYGRHRDAESGHHALHSIRQGAAGTRPTQPQTPIAPSTAAARTSHAVASIAYGDKSIRQGSRIEHDRFGRGTVASIEGSAGDARLNVRFDEAGTKTLLLKFARIVVLDA